MKRLFIFFALCTIGTLCMLAQSAGDKIIGNWLIDYDGQQSKVKIYKYDGGYRVQNYWVSDPYDSKGNLLYDTKNPDKSRRHLLYSQIVLVDKVVYDAKKQIWTDGHIYDPRSGSRYRMDIRFKDQNTLEIHGKWGPFYKKLYWKKVEK